MAIFDSWTLAEAEKALGVVNDTKTQAAQQFYDGDHWQAGKGWIGARPPANDPSYQDVLRQIEQGFVFENAVKGVVDRHVAGVLGNEPSWSFTVRRPLEEEEKPNDTEQALIDEAEAILTGEWWDRKKPHEALKLAVRSTLLRGRGILRLYIPMGLRQPDGSIRATDAEAAMRLIYVDTPSPDIAGVYTDPDTMAECGIFRYRRANGGIDGTSTQDWCELSYIGDDGNTMLRVVGQDRDWVASLPLRGRLLMYEITRETLVTPAVMQQQRLINLACTMMGRAINMAGFRERTFTNAAPPGTYVDSRTGDPAVDSTPQEYRKFVASTLPVGAGVTNFVAGLPIHNDQNVLVGYTNPNVNYGDPVPPTSFIDTKGTAREAILDESHQRHVLISGDATASAVSRKQARAEYEASLRDTAAPLADAGRWLIETAPNLATYLVGSPSRYDSLRPEFMPRIDSGPLSPEEEKALSDRHNDGLLSQATTMAEQGVVDVDAEIARIEREKAARAETELAQFNQLSQMGQQQPDPNTPPGPNTPPTPKPVPTPPAA